MFRASLATLLAAAVLGACSSPGSAPRETSKIRNDEGYLEKGPSVSLDETTPQGASTTLELLDARTRENAALKTQVEDLEKAAKAAEKRATEAEKQCAAREKEVAQFKELLERASTEQRVLTDEVLKSRISRLRTEQELLRVKLAELVKDEK